MKHEQRALIVQDTTDLNFSTRSRCEGLGQIGTNQTGAKSRGLRLHSSLALSESGLPLGVVQLQGYAPGSAEGKDPHRPMEQKESYRWLKGFREAMNIAALLPDTRVISVADREGEMFELFDFRRRQSGRKNKKPNFSLGEAMILIAQLGGCLNRKGDGVPGFESLWKGYARFYDMVEIVMLQRAAKSKES